MALGDTMEVACEPFCAVDDITADCGSLDASEVEELIDQVSDALAIMTDLRVTGRCQETFRPRGPSYSVCGCSRVYDCSCSPLRGITLPGPRPVVDSVTIDGVALAAGTDYTVVDGSLLVRVDGSWPGCQDVTILDGDDGSFVVVVTYGVLPLLAKKAAIAVVNSMVSNPADGRPKMHPQTRSLTVGGATITLDTVIEEIKRRTILLPEVARLLNVYAPETVPVAVYSPELDDGWVLHTTT